MSKLSVDLNGLSLKNPVTVASGTFGCGHEYSEFYDLSILGAISVKGITLKERKGNPAPRLHETPMGLLNSVGLQNPGVEHFIKEEIPFLRTFDTKIIANINGSTIEEYVELAGVLDKEDVDSIELNVSCPNVKAGGMGFGTNPKMLEEVVRGVRKATKKHLIVKLTPNVTDIVAMAKIAEREGADCLSLVNTFSGMAIDVKKREPVFYLKGAGLSGPAIKPLALKKVFDVYGEVDIPILGMGGIQNATDAIEFLLAGSSAIALGTSLFSDPLLPLKVIEGIESYLKEDEVKSIIGIAKK
ncbi:dihydroorotate dehydrogenase [Guggenheimella bovis]